MGHTRGRSGTTDASHRDTYVSVNYNAGHQGFAGNFDPISDNQQTLSPYDYASVMEYLRSLFRQREPCIETIPSRHPTPQSKRLHRC